MGQFKTRCSNDYGRSCETWKPKGTYVDSGVNTDASSSILELNLEMSIDGNVTFSYEVDGEPSYDYLAFSVDGKRLLKESTQLTWKTVSFPLSKGNRQLTWLYYKDPIISVGEDKAKLQFVEIQGAVDVVVYCDSCPPGTFSKEGALNCTKCPVDTYNPDYSASTCLSCPPLQTSFEGATKCFPKFPACTSNDYYSYFSSCTNGQREKIYQWVSPMLCNMTHPNSVTLPNPQNSPCDEKCAPGQKFTNGKCESCPNQSWSTGISECNECSGGKYLTPKYNYYNSFATFPQEWKKGCIGDCQSQGWRALGNMMDSGVGNGLAEAWFEFTFEPIESGYVDINYQLSCNSDTGFIEFIVNRNIFRKLTCSGCNSDQKIIQIPVKSGQNTIRVSYSQNNFANSDFTCSRAIVNNITTIGGSTGGSVSCTACEAGYISSTGSYKCNSCPAGTYSNSGDSSCKKCEPNTFSHETSSKCYDCGNGMVSNEGASSCSWKFNNTISYYQQMVGDKLMKFNWTELGSKLKRIPIPDTGEFLEFNMNLDPNSACPPGSYVCVITPEKQEPIDLGNSMDINIVNQHIQLTISNHKFNGSSVFTTMDLYCDPEERPFDPEMDVGVYGEYPGYWVEVFSYFGCFVCSKDDFEENINVCVDGKRNHVFTKKKTNDIPPFVCAMGEKPENYISDCSNSASFPVWVVFLIIGIFGVIVSIFIVIGVVFWFRHRKLQHQFQELVEDEDMGHEKL